MKEFVKEFDTLKINILYTYSNDFFKQGYDKLIPLYKNVNFIKENNFKEDLLKIMDENNKYSIFFVDDQVFKEPFSLTEIQNFTNELLCISLRLHPRLIYCYAASIPMRPITNTYFEWRKETGDFNYPMSLDSHIFLTSDIYPLLQKLNYINPNSLESVLAVNPINKPYMMCFDKSKTINNPCNKVQTNNPNKHGNITAEYLNQEYLKGYEIDLEIFKYMDNESCHKEIPVKLKKGTI
jgi:hypothetical protein